MVPSLILVTKSPSSPQTLIGCFGLYQHLSFFDGKIHHRTRGEHAQPHWAEQRPDEQAGRQPLPRRITQFIQEVPLSEDTQVSRG